VDRLKCAHIFQEINSPLRLLDYFKIFEQAEYSFLLDSGMDEKKLGRFSFTGGNPFLVFKSKGNQISLTHAGKVTHTTGNPFTELKQVMARYKIEPAAYPDPPFPFLGGAVGYFGYELCYFIEKLPCRGVDDLGLPDCYFMLVDTVIIYDHLLKKLYLSAVGFDSDLHSAREKAEQAFAVVRARMKRLEEENWAYAEFAGRGENENEAPEIRAMFDAAAYRAVVSQAKEHIFAGDIFEVCPTHRLETDFVGDAFELYRELRRINPAPFASFLNFPEVKVVSATPERFLRLRSDGWAESRPSREPGPGAKTRRTMKGSARNLRRVSRTGPKI
jgi:para-aminobenzoate synthetase component 1